MLKNTLITHRKKWRKRLDVVIRPSVKRCSVVELHEKKSTLYKEQNPEKVEAYLREIKDILPEKIAYVDETGIDNVSSMKKDRKSRQNLL